MEIIIGLAAAAIGFGIALYIHNKQKAKKPLMCPRQSPCETVISSPQSTTFGISNAVWGVWYYVAVFFSLTCIAVGGRSLWAELALALLTAGGVGFSAYLVRVQQKIIKQWCVWCLGSALMAVILFIATLIIIF
jgi:uncharacterized membrane protein